MMRFKKLIFLVENFNAMIDFAHINFDLNNIIVMSQRDNS